MRWASVSLFLAISFKDEVKMSFQINLINLNIWFDQATFHKNMMKQ